LFTKVAQGLQDKVTREFLWCGRHVKVIDDCTENRSRAVSRAVSRESESVANQAYPPMLQPRCVLRQQIVNA
jgi:hypothetical protein